MAISKIETDHRRAHMARNLIQDSVIPARHGAAFEVRKNQVLRIYLIEDKQVGDVVFVNANDYKEWFHTGATWILNGFLGTGTSKNFRHFYSKSPRENVMLTVLEDTVKVHWGNNGARCSRRMWELRNRSDQARSCQENLEEALAGYGISGDDIGDCFNLFLNAQLDDEGGFNIKEPTAVKGDYIDLRAEMDILTAISACPSDSITNAYQPKPLGVQIFE